MASARIPKPCESPTINRSTLESKTAGDIYGELTSTPLFSSAPLEPTIPARSHVQFIQYRPIVAQSPTPGAARQVENLFSSSLRSESSGVVLDDEVRSPMGGRQARPSSQLAASSTLDYDVVREAGEGSSSSSSNGYGSAVAVLDDTAEEAGGDDDFFYIADPEEEELFYARVDEFKMQKTIWASDDLSKLACAELGKEQMRFEKEFSGQRSAPKLVPPLKHLDRDWTREFLSILQRPPLERGEALSALSQQFVRTARAIGERIILEQHLPYHEKTVRPPPDQKGRAGGLKYFHSGIFFKFAVDSYKIYGGDKYAVKACGLELTALNTLASAGLMIGLNFPLTCIIDFIGHRLIAQSVLPINSQTLVYGSENRGRTVQCSSAKMNEAMKQLASINFIKAHRVGVGEQSKELYGPLDIEGHLGLDQHFYLCDVARYFPPECPTLFPSVGDKSSSKTFTGRRLQTCYLYRQLRPELLQSFSLPLSSDAFSPFGNHDREAHNGEVLRATHYLFAEIVPSLASKLDGVASLAPFGYDPAAQGATSSSLPNNGAIRSLLHRHGINIRWMGLVYRYMHNMPIRLIFLEEMIARVLKCEIQASLRSADIISMATMRTLALNQFNSIFSGAPDVWLRIRDLLSIKFECALSPEETEGWFRLRSQLNMFRLFQILQHQTGIHFSPEASDALRAHFVNIRRNPATTDKPFTLALLKEIVSTTKAMQILPRIEADSLYMHAESLKSRPRDAVRFYKLAISRYEAAIRATPSDASALANWGNVLVGLGQLHFQDQRAPLSEVERYFVQAHEKFRQSTETQGNNVSSYRSWITAVHIQLDLLSNHMPPPRIVGLYATLDKLYARLVGMAKALDSRHPSKNHLLSDSRSKWGCSLLQQARYLKQHAESGRTNVLERIETLLVQAEELLDSAVRLDSDNVDASVNLGVTLMVQASIRRDEYADELFSRAFSIFSSVEENPVGQGKAAYNIACLYGILLKRNSSKQAIDEPHEYERLCQRYLRQALDAGTLPKPQVVSADPDFQAVASRKWFIAIIDEKSRVDRSSRSFFPFRS